MRRARANNIAPASAESPKSGDVCLVPPLGGVTELKPEHLASKQVTQSTVSQAAPLGLTIPPKAGRARVSSKTHTQTNRLIIGLTSIQSELIASLSRQAEIAYTLRQINKVEALSKQLEQVHRPVASYWRGLAAQQQGEGNLDHAQKLLEQAVSHAPRNYQARALLALGSIAEYRGDYKAESEFYRAALALNHSDLFTAVEARRALAIRARHEGDHQKAIQILEQVRKLASYNPYLKAQLLNHLAIEYRDTGRLYEAVELARIAYASPFANIYHEFSETHAEIEQEIAETQSQTIVIVVPAQLPEQRPRQKVIFSFQYVESRARRERVIKPTIGRAPIIRSMVERMATVAPIHAPPFK